MKLHPTPTTAHRHRLRRLLAVSLALVMVAAVSESAFARGGFRGGGFRFSSGFRSFSGFRTSRAASGSYFRWGSASRRSGARGWGRSRAPINTATAIGGSRASMASQRSLYSAAQQRGTVFSTREQAVQSFRSRYAGQYTSRFASRPASRPSYIPATATVNGRPVDVAYSQQYGGYGYIDPTLGHWVFYNALANAATLNLLMAGNSYWWGAPPAYYAAPGSGFFSWGIILFFVFMGVSVVSRFLRQTARRDW